MRPPLVFVTRKYPPAVGGMETLAANVWRVLSSHDGRSLLIAYSGTYAGLIWWLPVAIMRLFAVLVRRGKRFVLVGDAATYALMYPLLRLFRVPNAVMVMGLDLTYSNRLYRAVVYPAIRRAPSVVAISRSTARLAREVGVQSNHLHVVAPGVQIPSFAPNEKERDRSWVTSSLGIPADSCVVLSLGRLVERKGVRWFVESVLPSLPDTVHLVIAGDGSDRTRIEETAKSAHVWDRVHILGQVDEVVKNRLMSGCDLLVQPNIPVHDDVEGFGLVIVEATLRGTPVVASDLQGIQDAVQPGITGFLLPPEDPDEWQRTLQQLASNREDLAAKGRRFRSEAIEIYGEDRMGRDLIDVIGSY